MITSARNAAATGIAKGMVDLRSIVFYSREEKEHWRRELKYIITSARNAAAIAKGMVELRSIVFYSREEREHWRQGPRCLRCSKLRRIGGLGGFTMAPRRSSGCGACIPELTTCSHRGRLSCLGSRAKASTLQGRYRCFAGGSVFHTSFRGLLSLSATQQKKWYYHLQQQVI